MEEFIIPVTWETCGIIKVKANSAREAYAKINNAPLPKENEYVDGSFVPTFTLEEYEELKKLGFVV